APSDVFGCCLGNLADGFLEYAAGRRSSPNAPPRRDEVGVATRVGEGIGGAAGTPTTLEACSISYFFLFLWIWGMVGNKRVVSLTPKGLTLSPTEGQMLLWRNWMQMTGSRLMPTVRMMVNHRVDLTDLQVDCENERRGGDDGKGLVVGGGFSVLPHGLKEGSVGDEEDDKRDKDAVEQADEEIPVRTVQRTHSQLPRGRLHLIHPQIHLTRTKATVLLTCEEYPLKNEYQKWTSVKAKFLKKK
ncbi:hypothetical protein FQN60_008419, partial [Etheostoma spectabile]